MQQTMSSSTGTLRVQRAPVSQTLNANRSKNIRAWKLSVMLGFSSKYGYKGFDQNEILQLFLAVMPFSASSWNWLGKFQVGAVGLCD